MTSSVPVEATGTPEPPAVRATTPIPTALPAPPPARAPRADASRPPFRRDHDLPR